MAADVAYTMISLNGSLAGPLPSEFLLASGIAEGWEVADIDGDDTGEPGDDVTPGEVRFTNGVKVASSVRAFVLEALAPEEGRPPVSLAELVPAADRYIELLPAARYSTLTFGCGVRAPRQWESFLGRFALSKDFHQLIDLPFLGGDMSIWYLDAPGMLMFSGRPLPTDTAAEPSSEATQATPTALTMIYHRFFSLNVAAPAEPHPDDVSAEDARVAVAEIPERWARYENLLADVLAAWPREDKDTNDGQ